MSKSMFNEVGNDLIWKNHVRKELTSQMFKWPERWNFMADEYRILHNRKGVQRGVKLPPIEECNLVRNKTLPRSTADQIGWKVKTMAEDQKYMKWAQTAPRKLRHLVYQLNWPYDGCF